MGRRRGGAGFLLASHDGTDGHVNAENRLQHPLSVAFADVILAGVATDGGGQARAVDMRAQRLGNGSAVAVAAARTGAGVALVIR